eukprot:gene6988-11154_t
MEEENYFDVEALPFSKTVIRKLQENGFKFLNDFEGLQTSELAKEAQISLKESAEILKYINGESKLLGDSVTRAIDLMASSNKPFISTYCNKMNEMLGGGVQTGCLTEFCGAPGLGKTQIAMQLCLTVQIPKKGFNGLEGKAIYIDTEGSFSKERIDQMSKSLLSDLKLTKEKDRLEAIEKITPDDFTKNIYYYRIHNLTEQLAIVNVLESFLIQNPDIKLIVFDSVAFHFRMGFENYSKRSNLLQGFARNLSAIASEFDIAVVIMNQVTTKIEKDKSEFIPALGGSWTHTCTHRVFLFHENKTRKAKLYKSNSNKESVIEYEINYDGVRSINPNKRNRQEEEE